MPIDWRLVYKLTANRLPIDCPFNANWEPITEFISVSANRSLPSIEGSDRLARSIDLLIQWQLKSKSLDWPRFRIVRVPPLGTSGGTSRPMRSQHSELSTNQEPRFGQDFWLWPKLESTNPMQMCQSAASLYREFIPVLNQPIWYQLRTNLKTIETQSNANLTPNMMLIDNQSDTNWELIWRQLRPNVMLINSQSNDYGQPIWCQLRTILKTNEIESDANWTPNQMLIDNQSDTNWQPIWKQLRPNLMSIEPPIKC